MDLKQKYWWTRMKGDIAEYVAQCDTYRRVKVEHNDPQDYSAIAYTSMAMG